MSDVARVKRVARLLLPPILTDGMRSLSRSFPLNKLRYVDAESVSSYRTSNQRGWNSASVTDAERRRWEAFVHNVAGSGPLGFSHEHSDASLVRDPLFHNVHISFAYVLALVSQHKSRISVLDWGGGLGHYHRLGRAVLPEVTIEFHCKEVPRMVEAGRHLNPEVQWHEDDRCLGARYDLVMANGSLQYMDHWQNLLHRLARATGHYFLLTRVPVVQQSPSFLAIQSIYGTQMVHRQFNQRELLAVVADTGLTLMRELVVGDRPYISGAPEQCELRGWLFRRD